MRKVSYRGKKTLRGCFSGDVGAKYCNHYTKGKGNEPIEECERCRYCEYYKDWKKEAKEAGV